MKYSDLPTIREKYNEIWKEIKSKYPTASGKLYFAFKGEFAQLSSGVIDLLKDNQYVFSADPIVQSLKRETSLKTKQKEFIDVQSLEERLQDVPLNPDCRIEIVWDELDYDLIRKLRLDPLVDLSLTPIDGGSIRIVLGRISS